MIHRVLGVRLGEMGYPPLASLEADPSEPDDHGDLATALSLHSACTATALTHEINCTAGGGCRVQQPIGGALHSPLVNTHPAGTTREEPSTGKGQKVGQMTASRSVPDLPLIVVLARVSLAVALREEAVTADGHGRARRVSSLPERIGTSEARP